MKRVDLIFIKRWQETNNSEAEYKKGKVFKIIAVYLFLQIFLIN
jgi:hypothetical protein